MIAEVIRQLHSDNWYGCGKHIEIAKGKNAMPKNWRDVKEKIKRARYMEGSIAKDKTNSTGIIKKIEQWLLNRK